MSRQVIRAVLVLALGAALATPAFADKETSIQLYRAGKRKYELGEYDKAISLFKQAYDEHPAPAYLYNVAQAYLKLDNCAEARDHLEKFLAEKPDAENRAAVDVQIAELNTTCPEIAPMPDPVPDPVEAPTPDPDPDTRVADAGADGGGDGTGGAVVTTAPTRSGPSLVAASADLGLSFFDIGDVILPVSPTVRLAAGYPLEFFGVAIEPGAAVEISSMAYEHATGDSSVMFTTLLVGAAAHLPVAAKISVGGDLGLGLFRFSGLKAGNPFIAALAAQQGSVTSFALRLGAQAEYDVGRGLAAALAPALVWAGGSSDLRDEISSFTRFELMLGVRYRR